MMAVLYVNVKLDISPLVLEHQVPTAEMLTNVLTKAMEILVTPMPCVEIMMVHMSVNVILDGLVMVTIHVTTKTNVHSAKMIVMIKLFVQIMLVAMNVLVKMVSKGVDSKVNALILTNALLENTIVTPTQAAPMNQLVALPVLATLVGSEMASSASKMCAHYVTLPQLVTVSTAIVPLVKVELVLLVAPKN